MEAVKIKRFDEQSMSGEELYSRFLKGDNDSFEKLVGLYENELLLFINGIIHEQQEAKRLMIESFARLAVDGKKFAGRSSLKTYLFTIGKNLALRHIKQNGNKHYLSFDDIENKLVDDSKELDLLMEREENSRQLHKAMQELKPDYRAVLRLLYFEDMSYLEAGRAMNKSERQIEGIARRAKMSMRKKLEDSGFVLHDIMHKKN